MHYKTEFSERKNIHKYKRRKTFPSFPQSWLHLKDIEQHVKEYEK